MKMVKKKGWALSTAAQKAIGAGLKDIADKEFAVQQSRKALEHCIVTDVILPILRNGRQAQEPRTCIITGCGEVTCEIAFRIEMEKGFLDALLSLGIGSDASKRYDFDGIYVDFGQVSCPEAMVVIELMVVASDHVMEIGTEAHRGCVLRARDKTREWLWKWGQIKVEMME